MGGGTGTGAAPIVAEVAKGRRSPSVITRPFNFEDDVTSQADQGIEHCSRVDTLIVIPNNKLLAVISEQTLQKLFGLPMTFCVRGARNLGYHYDPRFG